ncbi:uncharacterized protein LOC125941298 [Dermacentor silvarum]|uniref:uncharacterized protein LOC125941298 n=1 Tax=Dermacentor silvarum TaxID=543639 RepID=UPI0021015370|nr:uncharacterized protein LOC125941298 [Dermacentor silvarum]
MVCSPALLMSSDSIALDEVSKATLLAAQCTLPDQKSGAYATQTNSFGLPDRSGSGLGQQQHVHAQRHKHRIQKAGAAGRHTPGQEEEVTRALKLAMVKRGVLLHLDWSYLHPGTSRRKRHRHIPFGDTTKGKFRGDDVKYFCVSAVLLRVLRVQLEVRQQNRDVLHELQQLRHEVRVVSERLDEIEPLDRTRAVSQPALSTVPPVLPRLPANNIEELEAAEAAVQDEAVAATLRKHLLQIGGKSLREVASNAMKAVMAHPVQVLYSLHGRKGKRAFINLKLCRIVTDVICAKGGADLTEAQGFIKRWLPGSVDRGGGRKRRFAETLAAEQPDDPSLRGRDHCLPTAALSLPHPWPQGPGQSTVGPSCPAAHAPSPAAAPPPAPAPWTRLHICSRTPLRIRYLAQGT